MTAEEIKQKLRDNGLKDCIPIFEQNHLLDENTLATMTNDDYLSIGISIIGDRKKLLSMFQPKKDSISQTREEPKFEREIEQPQESPKQNIVIEKKSSGVWIFIGVLVAIILIIIIISSL